jgi:hypothetical protein
MDQDATEGSIWGMRMKEEQTKRGVERCERSTPQETPGLASAEIQSIKDYDTNTGTMKEGMGDFPIGKARPYILHAAQTLFAPSQVVELRVIFKNGRVDSGYFDDFPLLAEAAANMDRRADVSGIYWTLNPVNPDCLHRAKNRMREWASKSKGGATTSDSEILERRLLFLDFDGANRPAGISATEGELKAAKEKALRVAKFLDNQKWEAPIAAMSGNGYHLLYRTDLTNNSGNTELVKKFLASLSLMFDDGAVKIDTSVFNASRVCKVYGTIAKKGDDTPERPHRRSLLLKMAGERLGNG